MKQLELNRKEYSNVTFTTRRVSLLKRSNQCSLMGDLRVNKGLNLLPLGICINDVTLNEINPLLESTLELEGEVELKLLNVEGITTLVINVKNFGDRHIRYIDLATGKALFRFLSEKYYWEEENCISITSLLSDKESLDTIPVISDETCYFEDIEEFLDYSLNPVNVSSVLSFTFTEESGLYVGYITVVNDEGYNNLLIIESVEQSKLHLLIEYLGKYARVHSGIWGKLLMY